MNELSIFLLLGGNKLNHGIYQKFKNLGMLVYVVDWNEFPAIKGDRHYRIDVKDPYAIIGALKNDNVFSQVAFAYTSIDVAIPTIAKINKAIGLKAIDDDALKYALSKSLMTMKWKADGLLNRVSNSYSSYSDEIFNALQSSPLIIKPDNASSSRGITICDQGESATLLEEAFHKARNESSNNTVVVEEFIEGTEYTVEMLGDSYGHVGVYAISEKSHTQHIDRNKIAVKLHYNISDIKLQKKIADYAIRCYQSLGFNSCLGHLEILLKNDGTLSPIEIGARSSGYIASDLVDIVSGKNYLMDAYAVYRGGKIEHGLQPQTSQASMYFFYDFPDNCRIKKISSLINHCDASIVSRYHDRSRLEVGASFKKIDNDNARVGFEILEGPREVMTAEHIIEAENNMIKAMVI